MHVGRHHRYGSPRMRRVSHIFLQLFQGRDFLCSWNPSPNEKITAWKSPRDLIKTGVSPPLNQTILILRVTLPTVSCVNLNMLITTSEPRCL